MLRNNMIIDSMEPVADESDIFSGQLTHAKTKSVQAIPHLEIWGFYKLVEENFLAEYQSVRRIGLPRV